MTLGVLCDKLYIDLRPSERRRLKAEVFLYMRKNPPELKTVETVKQVDSVILTVDCESDYFESIVDDFISKSEFGPRLSAIYHANPDSQQ